MKGRVMLTLQELKDIRKIPVAEVDYWTLEKLLDQSEAAIYLRDSCKKSRAWMNNRREIAELVDEILLCDTALLAADKLMGIKHETRI